MTIAADNAETRPMYSDRIVTGEKYTTIGQSYRCYFDDKENADVPWGSYAMPDRSKPQGVSVTLDEKLRESRSALVNDRFLLAVSLTYKHRVYTGNSIRVEWVYPNRPNTFTFYLVERDIIDRLRYASQHCTVIVKGKRIEIHTVMDSGELAKMRRLFRQPARGKTRWA